MGELAAGQWPRRCVHALACLEYRRSPRMAPRDMLGAGQPWVLAARELGQVGERKLGSLAAKGALQRLELQRRLEGHFGECKGGLGLRAGGAGRRRAVAASCGGATCTSPLRRLREHCALVALRAAAGVWLG